MLPFVIDPLSVVMVFALWPVVGGLDSMPTTSEDSHPEYEAGKQVAKDTTTFEVPPPENMDNNADGRRRMFSLG